MVFVGIDQSISSTAISILDNDGKEWFYLIKPHLSKKELEVQHSLKNLTYVVYQKNVPNKTDEYWQKEQIKLDNITNIVDKIKQIVESFEGVKIISIEGLSYGSRTSSLVDLSGLNYLIRNALKNYTIFVFAPSSVKRFWSGMGNASKEIMTQVFIGMHPEFRIVPVCHDIADATAILYMGKRLTENNFN